MCGDREREGETEKQGQRDREKKAKVQIYKHIHSRESVKNIDLYLKTFSATSKKTFSFLYS